MDRGIALVSVVIRGLVPPNEQRDGEGEVRAASALRCGKRQVQGETAARALSAVDARSKEGSVFLVRDSHTFWSSQLAFFSTDAKGWGGSTLESSSEWLFVIAKWEGSSTEKQIKRGTIEQRNGNMGECESVRVLECESVRVLRV